MKQWRLVHRGAAGGQWKQAGTMFDDLLQEQALDRFVVAANAGGAEPVQGQNAASPAIANRPIQRVAPVDRLH